MAGTATPKGRTAAKKAPRKAAAEKSPSPEESMTSDELRAELAALATDESMFDENGDVRGLDLDKRGQAGVEMVHIFTLDGVRYSIPKRPNKLLLVGYLKRARAAKTNSALNEATYDLYLKLLGPAAVEALESSPLVGDKEIGEIFAAVTKVAFDAIAEMRGTLADSGN